MNGAQARNFLREVKVRYEAQARLVPPRHDWAWRARRTIADLVGSPKATCVEYGDLYVMPYVNGQYPDSMVQLAWIVALRAAGRAGFAIGTLEADLRRGVHRFHDPEVRTLRRYLPSVGNEKDFDAVDSWYLYHPMMNLARLAREGDEEMRDLLMRSVEYGVRAAHHFNYAWPVIYDIRNFDVIMQSLDEGRPGETDAGGLYAYLMLQMFELTDEQRYLREAQTALEAADGRDLSLMYQVNLTAWGAAACLKLWRLTGDDVHLNRGHYWLANLFHHCRLEESDQGAARHYPTFMGMPCMYNSAYMASFEDVECHQALGECLALAEHGMDPAAAFLMREFRRHALHRAWYFYPDRLPSDIIADRQESGEIDPELSFPLEDLYLDGSIAGQVGQEIYGAGAALIYAASSDTVAIGVRGGGDAD